MLERAESYGKHLFVDFDDDLVHVHLGLYGRFDVHRDVGRGADAGRPGPAAAGPATATGARVVRRPARRHRLRAAHPGEQREALVARLGPDPLRPDADPDRAWQRIRRSRAPIGGLLMDQSVVAGIGNVYRAELLYRHRVDPFRPGRSLRVGRGGRCGTTWSS